MAHTQISSPEAQKLGINFTFFVIYMAGLSAFGSFVNDMYIPSLPEMTDFFHCSVSTVQLGLTTGMIGLAIGQIFFGPISDKYGRKPILLGGLILFIIAAVVSIFSPTITFFLVCRAFQGMGASSGYLLARTMPADVFEGRALAKTMAIIGAINGFAPASAPVLGGFISAAWGWRGVFVTLAALSALLLVFVPKVKETLEPARRATVPILKTFGNYKLLLTNKKFMVHVLLKGAALGVMFAYISGASFIYQRDFGFSELQFGLIMGANALFVVAGAMISLKFKILKQAAVIGCYLLTLFMAALTVLAYLLHDFWSFQLLILPVLFCLGMIFTVGNTLAMNEGRIDAGSASAILGVGGYFFGAIVSPLAGGGDVMRSTATVMMVVTLITLVFGIWTRQLAPDDDMVKKS